jgi:PAS domain S-box-containing protein
MVDREVENRASEDGAASKKSAEGRTQLHLRLQYIVAQILAQARTEQDACAGVLSSICENLGWEWAACWMRRGEELRLAGCWHGADCKTQEFDQISRACVFKIGEGMPGRVWAEREAIWIADFCADSEMPRRHAAARCDFHAAIGIPISGKEFLGVIELFKRQPSAADAALLEMVSAIGAQAGQFLERKRAEKALAESQGLFQGVFQGARDAILLADNDGKLVEANAAASKLLGLERDELLERNVWDFLAIEAPTSGLGQWAEILQTPGTEGEFTLRRGNGATAELDFRVTTNVIPGAHLVVLRDLTGRKQRERSARILAAAGAILGEGLDWGETVNRVARVAVPEFADWCILDLLTDEGAIERAAMAHANPQIEQQVRQVAKSIRIDPMRAFGSPNVIRTGKTEALEITPELFRIAAGEENSHLLKELNLANSVIAPLKRQGRTFGALSFWRTKARGPFSAGDTELAEELARRAGWALENARLYEAARVELQLREKVEAELMKLNAQLENRIAERTAALQESHSQLESFCYSVSHDLRAPLRSMQGFSHALIEDHADKLNSEGQDFAQRILSAAEHMDGLLADVLAYSRLSRQELKPEPVRVDEVLEDARMQLHEQIRKRGAEVQVSACERKVLANRSVLELMIVNLLDNALKFVTADRLPKVVVSCERRGEMQRIWVRDNGIGIPAEHRQKIFRIFERLHGVEAYPGTGIGLALVQKAAERMNGAVGVESAPGEGSSFWIELPAANTE